MRVLLFSLLEIFLYPSLAIGAGENEKTKLHSLPFRFPLPDHHCQLSWHRLASLNVTFPELQSVVETNAKQRFTLIPAPELATDLELATDSDHTPTHDPLNPAHHLIRATQGHSLPIASENLLTPILATDPDCPDLVVHGTFHSKWKLIRESGGLRPMGRQHVHFALGLPSEGAALFRPGANTITSASTTEVEEKQKGNGDSSEQIANPTSTADDPTLAPVPTLPSATQAPTSAKQSLSSQPVISGMRATATVLIWVDLKRSLEAGALKWWRSANGVVLTEGDAKGKVGLEWVNRVEMRGGKESALVGMR